MSSLPTTLRDAIISGVVPQYIASQPWLRDEKPGTRMELPLRDDGTRYVVSGLTPQPGLSQITYWQNVDFVDCTFSHGPSAVFIQCGFTNCQLNCADDKIVSYEVCQMNSTVINGGGLRIFSCRIEHSEIPHRNTVTLEIVNSHLHKCEINCNKLVGSVIHHSTISNCIVKASLIENLRFKTTRISESEFSSQVTFERCEWDDVTIDRETIESLGPNRGDMNDTTIRKLKVIDHIADLRLIFGGMLFHIHVGAMLFFLSQYLGFIGWKLLVALQLAGHLHDTDYLFTALLKFAFCGVSRPEDFFGVLSCIIRSSTFLSFVVYNVARLILLLKSLELEHKKEIIGIWPAFSKYDRAKFIKWDLPRGVTWDDLISWVSKGTYLAIVCGLLHFFDLLRMLVPE